MAAFDTENTEPVFTSEATSDPVTLGEPGSCGDGHTLDTNEYYGSANALGDFIEGPPLRMACRNLRNRG